MYRETTVNVLLLMDHESGIREISGVSLRLLCLVGGQLWLIQRLDGRRALGVVIAGALPADRWRMPTKSLPHLDRPFENHRWNTLEVVLKFNALFEDEHGPLLVEGSGSLTAAVVQDLAGFKGRLARHGAILFRNFAVHDANDFDEFVAHWSPDHLKYMYRSTPRTEVTKHVVTSTSYPASLEIPLHNENSYHRHWPKTVSFCCLEPASHGGQTPIASMREVSRRIGSGLMERFEHKRVEYIRHYHEGIDLPWQSVFQTESRDEVEAYCRESAIHCDWIDGKLLRTSGIAQGVTSHPLTGEKIFFNQAHLFHVSSLGPAYSEALIALYGVERLPRHARFGDGTEIATGDLQQVRDAFEKSSLSFRWQKGDVLVLDNMAYAHGRRPFKGSRKVLAALMDAHVT